MSQDAVVIDPSLAMRWALNLPYSGQATILLQSWVHQGTRLLAPHLFIGEVSTALFAYVRNKSPLYPSITLIEAERLLAATLDVMEIHSEDLGLARRSLRFAYETNRTSTLDSLYAALAERENCPLWTADEKFWNGVKATYPWVRCVADPTLQTAGPSQRP